MVHFHGRDVDFDCLLIEHLVDTVLLASTVGLIFSFHNPLSWHVLASTLKLGTCSHFYVECCLRVLNRITSRCSCKSW